MGMIRIPWHVETTITALNHGFSPGDVIAIYITNPAWWRRTLAFIRVSRFLYTQHTITSVTNHEITL